MNADEPTLSRRRDELGAYIRRLLACGGEMPTMAAIQVLNDELAAIEEEMGMPQQARKEFGRYIDDLIRKHATQIDEVREFQRHLRRLLAEGLTLDDVVEESKRISAE